MRAAPLQWERPTTNADGTPITDLAGYRIYRARSPVIPSRDTMELIAIIPDTSKTSLHVIAGDAYGIWYFSVSSFRSDGTESAMSEPRSIRLPPLRAS